MFIGTEIAYDPRLSRVEKLYVRMLGVPINGLRIRARRVLPVVCGRRFTRALDAGCGLGVFSMEMAKRSPESRVVGMDADEEQIRINSIIAGKAELKNLLFEVGDATKLAFECEFDLVLSVDVIEHVEDDAGVCRGIYRALKPGGRLVMHVPAMYRWWILFGRRLNFTTEKGHVRPGYTPESIVSLLQAAGFVTDSVQHTYGWLETVTNNVANLVSRSNKRNKAVYGALFPLLLFVSYWGQFSNPKTGSGVLVTAHKQ